MEYMEKYRTGWRRFFAAWIDAACLSVLAVPLEYLPETFPDGKIYAAGILQLLYVIVLTWRFAGTPGKRILGLDVVDYATEGPISLLQSCKREIGMVALWLVGVGWYMHLRNDWGYSPRYVTAVIAPLVSFRREAWLLLEILTMFMNEKRRAIHDLIAGTVVVRAEYTKLAPEPSHSIAETSG